MSGYRFSGEDLENYFDERENYKICRSILDDYERDDFSFGFGDEEIPEVADEL